MLQLQQLLTISDSILNSKFEILFLSSSWRFFEGPFKGHAPTGDMAQFYGIEILQVLSCVRLPLINFLFTKIKKKKKHILYLP